MKDCPFCNIPVSEKILETEYSFAVYDKYPVNKGHTLIIPKKHTSDYFNLTEKEKNDLWKLTDKVSAIIRKSHSPDGFNIGININKAAGQTVPHVHIHLIPRYNNDVDNPAGGVRCVIPSKQKY